MLRQVEAASEGEAEEKEDEEVQDDDDDDVPRRTRVRTPRRIAGPGLWR